MNGHKGKRKAPNDMYWCNMTITNSYKCVMVEKLNDIEFRAWSNSKLASFDETFTPSSKRLGWYYKDVLEEQLTFFDWN